MATAEEGGVNVNSISSSYGDGGAGGKFRKKPIRRPTTPYDRPPTALRRNNDKNNSWLKKLVVEPASKLISYGAERFFAPLLRKRLPPPPPPPPQPAEAKSDVSDRNQGVAPNNHNGLKEPVGGDYSQPINSLSRNGIADLEQLLKHRTFTRSEIVHLRELLQSRAAEVSLEDIGQKNEVTALDYERDQQLSNGLLDENRNGRNRSSTFMSTPVINSVNDLYADEKLLQVVEDVNASPAELAKAYMGSRPSKGSPSVLGIRSRDGMGGAGLLSSLLSTSGSPMMGLTKKTHRSTAASDNMFITPRSRSRSAIYSMARTPYSKVHPTSSIKGSGINWNGYAGPGPSASSSILAKVDIDDKFDSHPMSLKRRSSVLDDELGSIGPIRRIRQKSNFVASRFHKTTHGMGIDSTSRQKFPLISEQRHRASKDVVENENETVPISSYPLVPSKSSEVASKILEHLEKITPKDKSPPSKLVARKEKAPSLTPSMIPAQALRSMEDVGSSRLVDLQDDNMLGDKSNVMLADARDFSMQKKGKVEENDPKEYVDPLDKWHPESNSDSVVSLKASMPSTSASGSIIKNDASHLQKKRAFMMSAQEDYSEQDDDVHCNGLVSISTSKTKGPMGANLTDSKVILSEELKLVKPSMNTSEPTLGAITSGEVSTVVSLSASDKRKEAPQSDVLSQSLTSSEKPNDENNAPLFSFSSKVVEKVASVPSQSIKESDTKIESSSSLVSIPPPTGSIVCESEKSSLKVEDANGKSDGIPFGAPNGPSLSSNAPPMSIGNAALPNDPNQISNGGSAFLFSSSANGGSTSTNNPATSISGLSAAKPSIPAGIQVSQFGASANPATSVPAESATNIFQAKLNHETNISENISSSLTNAAAFGASSSTSSTTFGLGSSVSFLATQNSVEKPPMPVNCGSASQDVSSTTQPVSSVPVFNFSSSNIPFGSSSGSQVSKPSIAFGLTPASSSDNTSSPSTVKFGTKFTEATGVSSTSATPTPNTGIFTFGLSSSTSSTSVGLSSATLTAATTPGFTFGLSSTPSSTPVGSSSATPALSFPAISSGSAPVSTTTITTNMFTLGGNSSSVPTSGSTSSNGNPFAASWQNPKPSPFLGSSNVIASGFSFGACSSSSAPSTSVFNASSSAAPFSFTTPSSQPTPVLFGGADQMNADDSMAEDHPPPVVPSIFSQPGEATPTPLPTFGVGQSGQPAPFVFGGQPNQVGGAAPQNPNPFQASGSLEFNVGGSFSLGSGGGDRSGRKIVKISRTKNRKK